MKRLLSTFLLIGVIVVTAVANPKIKFGSISDSEMNMKYYEDDSSANAVILYDKGRFTDKSFEFKRHVRIKILNKNGTSWANWTLRTPSQSSFRAITYNRVDGEIVKEKLEKTSVHKEELVNGILLYKLFLPNVKAGSVIDLEYTFNGIPFEWRFQQLIPVKYCELELEKSNYIHYNKRSFGFHPITTVGPEHWVAESVPAFVQEPYLSHYGNYLTKLQFEISTISIPGRYHREYSTSWEQVSKVLLESPAFGDVIRGCSFLNEKAKEIKTSDVSIPEKIEMAYDYIKENIKWNEQNSLFASRGYKSNFKVDHSGNSAEINLMLISLMRKAGLNAYPVVLSTRDNGLIMPIFPSLEKLNYVVVYTRYGDNTLLLDASDKYGSVGIVPAKCLNGDGWLVDEGYGEWIDLAGKNKLKSKSYYQLSMSEGGFWSGQISRSKYAYRYKEWAEKYNEANDEKEYTRMIEEKFEGVIIEGFELSKNDIKTHTVTEKFIVDLDNFVDDLGAETMINPFIFNQFTSNPFKSNQRKYPVDLMAAVDASEIYMIQVPEGYDVKGIPESSAVALPNGAGKFTFLSSTSNNQIQLQVKLKIDQVVFTEKEYEYLKGFYSMIIDKLSESIQLAKRT